MTDLEQYIEDALHRGVELSREEYMAACEREDAVAEAHGSEGEAPLSEEERHKRIQMNFYGTVINFLASILCEVSETHALLLRLLKEESDG